MILGLGYRLVHPMPSGSLGCVYAGVDPLGRSVVLKVLPIGRLPRELASLRQLLSAQAAVTHRGLLTPLDIIPVDGGLVVVSELVQGGSLAAALARRGPMGALQVARGAALVAEALGALHITGFVHGGVKASNVLLRGGVRPVLTDTGIGRWMSAATSTYLPPELPAGVQPGPESDVYALGALCWESLTQRPLEACRPGRRRAPGPWPDVPPGLGAVLAASISTRPADRPTASELSAEMRRLALTTCGPAPPVSARPARPASPAPPVSARPARPASPAPPVSAPRMSHLRRIVGAGAILVIVGSAIRMVGGVTSSAHSAGLRTPPTSPSPAAGCVTEQPAAPAATIVANVPGTVCVRMSWSNGTLTLLGSSRRFVLGEPGDELLVGDWACQGEYAPALYRPSTGQVFVWRKWASPGHPVAPARVADTGIRNGLATTITVSLGTKRCDKVSVEPQKPQ